MSRKVARCTETSGKLRSTVSFHSSENSHLDIFLEMPDFLVTYQAPETYLPLFNSGSSFLCKKGADHRKIYLDFSGTLSLGRGEVRIVWQGEYFNLEKTFFEEMFLQRKDNILILSLKADT